MTKINCQSRKAQKQSVTEKNQNLKLLNHTLVKNLEQIRIDEIDHVFLEDFKFYLNISKYEGSTIEKYYLLLRVAKYAVAKGYTKRKS
jgi:hypothetical protein